MKVLSNNKFCSPFRSRFLQTKASSGVVVREYLNLHLNSGDLSYFVRNAPVHSSEPLKFGEMWGESDYRKAVWNQYQCANGFMTPVEIFKPHYAVSLANYMITSLKSSFGANYLSQFSPEKPLVICEIGGGNGTCLKGILDYLKDTQPDVFAVLKCISIDVSPEFVKLQQATLSDYLEKVKFVNKSIFEINEKDLNVVESVSFVIGLEILDNLPHDKLVMSPESRMLQVVVNQEPCELEKSTLKYSEKHVPISDLVIVEFLETVADIVGVKKDCFTKSTFKAEKEHLETLKELHLLWNYFSGSSRADWPLYKRFLYLLGQVKYKILPLFDSNSNIITYVPTGAYLFLKFLKRYFPKHFLILSDFNSIQGSGIGVNAPLVQKIVGNTVSVKSTYLEAPLGTFDIFFPTNFTLLSHVYQKVMTTEENSVQVLSTKSFMKANSNYQLTRTRLGYNPLLDDFSNTAFLLASRF